MVSLHFIYSTMNAGKSTHLLQAANNYEERGMRPFLLTAALDDRYGQGMIVSRIGIKREAVTFAADTDLYQVVLEEHEADIELIACVFVDEAQFLSDAQVWQLSNVVDELGIPVMCYGLRTDFQGNTFPGSERLMAIADELRETRTICHCGKRATMVLRISADGKAMREGPQNLIGGNDTYVSVCRRHWKEAFAE